MARLRAAASAARATDPLIMATDTIPIKAIRITIPLSRHCRASPAIHLSKKFSL